MQMIVGVPIVRPPRVYNLWIRSPATIILDNASDYEFCKRTSRAMRCRSSARRIIHGCTIPGLPRAPRYIPKEKSKCGDREPLQAVQASSFLPNLDLGGKSRIDILRRLPGQ